MKEIEFQNFVVADNYIAEQCYYPLNKKSFFIYLSGGKFGLAWEIKSGSKRILPVPADDLHERGARNRRTT